MTENCLVSAKWHPYSTSFVIIPPDQSTGFINWHPFSYLKLKKCFSHHHMPDKIQKISDAYQSALLWDVSWKLVIWKYVNFLVHVPLCFIFFDTKTCQVAIEVEREEDEGGTVGETFTDYVSIISKSFTLEVLLWYTLHLWTLGLCIVFGYCAVEFMFTCSFVQRPTKLSIGPPHPDPIVETSSLSAVQPPEPIYDLKTKDDLESTRALSCLQIETLVYACQVVFYNRTYGWWLWVPLLTSYCWFDGRDTFNTFQMVPGLDSLLETELVWVKVEQLRAWYGKTGAMRGGKHCKFWVALTDLRADLQSILILCSLFVSISGLLSYQFAFTARKNAIYKPMFYNVFYPL